MPELTEWAALFGGIGLILGAVAVYIKTRAYIEKIQAEEAHDRQYWEQSTIDRLRSEQTSFWTDRERVLCERLDAMQVLNTAQAKRIDALEFEISDLRNDNKNKDERITELTGRVHKLEIENTRLLAQREARDEQIDLLKEQLGVTQNQLSAMQQQTAALMQLSTEVGNMVRRYTGRDDGNATEEVA